MSIKSAKAKEKISLTFALLLSAFIITLITLQYYDAFIYATKIARERYTTNPISLFLIVPLAFLLSAYLCKYFAPYSAGSGTNHILSALSKLDKDSSANIGQYIGIKTIIITIISSLISCIGGGALGSEGPIVQISASIILFIVLFLKRCFPDIDLRKWIIAGSASGFAIVFNAPFAAILFAIEELTQCRSKNRFALLDWKVPLMVFISIFVRRYLTNSDAILSFPLANIELSHRLIFSCLLVAFLSGTSAYVMKIITDKFAKMREAASKARWFIFPLLFGLLVASVSFVVGSSSFGSGMDDIEASMSTSNTILHLEGFFGRFINIIGSLSAGCAGGILLPSLTLGAYIGSAVSDFMNLEDTRILISIGMSAFLGAIIRAPFTTAILILEITNQTWLVFPLLICSLLSSKIYELLRKIYL